ncbi:DUF3732 domain-containing protein [Schinkia azotoformans]|uniref:DUF3732 domain-containing protein n=1 Tax=Schinkia azotoformans TaxID=1454 RepID=UPI002E20827E|nr:DUF3732 domain-containing protein [Schinkia azotoformans]
MTFQIKELVLYNKEGETRSLEFKIGKVNIITGKSGAGKSAIIEIIDYCLGRSKFNIPDGVIRRTVSWYAIKLQINNSMLFIAKPTPKGNNESQSEVYLEIATQIKTPNYIDLVPNTNDDGLNEYLSRLIGISPNLNKPDELHTREPLAAKFKHAKFYLFQKQSVVANEQLLFHRQSEPFIPQMIKDSLPYFLGAVREDQLKIEDELRREKRTLKLLRKKLKESELISGEGISKSKGLLLEAKEVGLIKTIGNGNSLMDNIEKLRGIQNKEIDILNINHENTMLANLYKKRKIYINKMREITDKINEARIINTDMDGYSQEVIEQKSRLDSIKLFNEIDDEKDKCPLCLSELKINQPSLNLMNASLKKLYTKLNEVSKERPNLDKLINTLESDLDDIKGKLNDINNQIKIINEKQEELEQINDFKTSVAKVIGRISLFLESVIEIDEESDLLKEINNQEELIANLERKINKDEVEGNLNSILNLIGNQMTAWAKHLKLEHSMFPYRFDLNKLTVIADSEERPIPMFRMGSGENWLGCHIILLLALHKFFIKRKRPVPNFIIIDQPTQVYFPAERYKTLEGRIDEITDEDIVAVKRLFDLLIDVCEEMESKFQIIVMDHANIIDKRFQESLVEEPWRNGVALIPENWI